MKKIKKKMHSGQGKMKSGKGQQPCQEVLPISRVSPTCQITNTRKHKWILCDR